jgi:hypothetical protein
MTWFHIRPFRAPGNQTSIASAAPDLYNKLLAEDNEAVNQYWGFG